MLKYDLKSSHHFFSPFVALLTALLHHGECYSIHPYLGSVLSVSEGRRPSPRCPRLHGARSLRHRHPRSDHLRDQVSKQPHLSCFSICLNVCQGVAFLFQIDLLYFRLGL